MTIEEIEKMIAGHYQDLDQPSELKETFKQVLVKFIQYHHVEDEMYDSLFCTIHHNFEDGHNCVACNLNESNRCIENFLFGYKHFHDPYMVMTNFIMQLYLQVEQIFEYLRIIQLPENYVQKHFHYFQTIKRWANFLKHPKTFMLVHHPIWEYDTLISSQNKTSKEFVINSKFVNEYYAGDSKNKELYRQLVKKESVKVIFPNPIKLIEEFCNAQGKFVELIKENKVVREVLNDKGTITDYYNQLPRDNDYIE